jgi:hypothetical protein
MKHKAFLKAYLNKAAGTLNLGAVGKGMRKPMPLIPPRANTGITPQNIGAQLPPKPAPMPKAEPLPTAPKAFSNNTVKPPTVQAPAPAPAAAPAPSKGFLKRPEWMKGRSGKGIAATAGIAGTGAALHEGKKMWDSTEDARNLFGDMSPADRERLQHMVKSKPYLKDLMPMIANNDMKGALALLQEKDPELFASFKKAGMDNMLGNIDWGSILKWGGIAAGGMFLLNMLMGGGGGGGQQAPSRGPYGGYTGDPYWRG